MSIKLVCPESFQDSMASSQASSRGGVRQPAGLEQLRFRSYRDASIPSAPSQGCLLVSPSIRAMSAGRPRSCRVRTVTSPTAMTGPEPDSMWART